MRRPGVLGVIDWALGIVLRVPSDDAIMAEAMQCAGNAEYYLRRGDLARALEWEQLAIRYEMLVRSPWPGLGNP